MEIKYNSLYTHFIFVAREIVSRLFNEKHRERVKKYITDILKNNDCKLYSIYANPEHVHFLASRSPKISEEALAITVSESSENFINENKLSATKPS